MIGERSSRRKRLSRAEPFLAEFELVQRPTKSLLTLGTHHYDDLSQNPDQAHVGITHISHNLDMWMKYCWHSSSMVMGVGFFWEFWSKLSVSLLIESKLNLLNRSCPSRPLAFLPLESSINHESFRAYIFGYTGPYEGCVGTVLQWVLMVMTSGPALPYSHSPLKGRYDKLYSLSRNINIVWHTTRMVYWQFSVAY